MVRVTFVDGSVKDVATGDYFSYGDGCIDIYNADNGIVALVSASQARLLEIVPEAD